MDIISKNDVKKRFYWIQEIRKISGNFGEDSDRLERELEADIAKSGIGALINHLRLCGSIPESYGHDTSEEKLYSKYTDCLLSISYRALGLKSIVLKERGDSADVEAFARDYSFVADAKSFRLSRTAKNQKDFKVQAMDSWKRDKPYAMVVCPIYQLPNTSSQIYQQATSKNICIFTYSHLSLLLAFSEVESKSKTQQLLKNIFQSIVLLNPSKSAFDYWYNINKTMLSFSKKIEQLWLFEKEAATQSITIAKEEALTFLAQEREKIVRMSHKEAINELIRVCKIDSKIRKINAVTDNGLFLVK
ncbi:MAG: HindIII family type II restriction endonuclease [Ignavibacteria bacterium]|nr:HindIII family type II restriction endonuclease [Ignavibacteria bacterium]